MTTTITTAAELDALLDLFALDQNTAAEIVILDHASRAWIIIDSEDGPFAWGAWWEDDGDHRAHDVGSLGLPLTVLSPAEPQRVQPSVEDLVSVVMAHSAFEFVPRTLVDGAESGVICTGCGWQVGEAPLRSRAQHLADAVLALLPGRTEAEVVEQYRALDGYTDALRDVALERMTHEQRGWTAEHDAEHGVLHLVGLAHERTIVSRMLFPSVRSELVKAASLLVAAIELIDRQKASNG